LPEDLLRVGVEQIFFAFFLQARETPAAFRRSHVSSVSGNDRLTSGIEQAAALGKRKKVVDSAGSLS
jgi:hypothetical protein